MFLIYSRNSQNCEDFIQACFIIWSVLVSPPWINRRRIPWSMAFLWGTSVKVKDKLHIVCFADSCMRNYTPKKSASNLIPDPQTSDFLLVTSSNTFYHRQLRFYKLLLQHTFSPLVCISWALESFICFARLIVQIKRKTTSKSVHFNTCYFSSTLVDLKNLLPCFKYIQQDTINHKTA